MEVNTRPKPIGRGRGRPAQALYMPPARRNRGSDPTEPRIMEDKTNNKLGENQIPIIQFEDVHIDEKPHKQHEDREDLKQINHMSVPLLIPHIDSETDKPEETKAEEESEKSTITNCVSRIGNSAIDQPREQPKIVSHVQTADKVKIHTKSDKEKEKDKEVTKAKTKNVKVMDVKCDVLQISLAKNIKKSPIKLVQVDQWEDLINDEDVETTSEDIKHNESSKNMVNYEDYDSDEIQNLNDTQLEHILEIYDFPSTFKTPDIMQIYNELDQNSIYIKWLSDTRALLVLGSAIQAKRALNIENPLVKARPAALASPMALEMIRNSNLRPAMKRPQTSMQAARRMITTALGAKSSVSREVQQREREALRKAKEERRTQRQNERDAWEGNPRPTTA